jgi:hypothetical protein
MPASAAIGVQLLTERTAMKIIVHAVVLVTTIAAIWGATVMFVHTSTNPNDAVVANSSSIDVMQMMLDAKNLRDEKFDTH